jgi:CheY-like chemotaxis protein
MPAILKRELSTIEAVGSNARNVKSLRSWSAKPRESNPTKPTQVRRRPLRVLVVDDDYDTTDGLTKQVVRWGHSVELAYDGATALRVAAAQHPDVVLLDIGMPFLDGFKVAQQLRRDFRKQDCFIIAVSGMDNGQRRERCAEAQIDLLLIKPVDSSIIETLLMLESERINRLADVLTSCGAQPACSIRNGSAITHGIPHLAPI